MSVKLNIRHAELKDVPLQGELPARLLELDSHDELVHTRTPLQYDLVARKAGDNIVVQGRLELTLDCECSRCLKKFPFEVVLPDWTAHLALEGPEKAVIKDDLVDLTPYLREDILLELPQHPLCEADCAGLPNRAVDNGTDRRGAGQNSAAWSELNKLKF